MKHVKIAVSKIHPNPHRIFARNPIVEEQVEKVIDSIGRTGFWDNIVVRPFPGRPGEYQLAYGHTRLEAVKRLKIESVTIPVKELSDWDMYCAMADENESQRTITTSVVFENIEAGVEILERTFRTIGPKGTYEQFNETLGRCVPRGTHLPRKKKDGTFERTKKAFFDDEGIGRVFVESILPSNRIHSETISAVLETRYGQQRAKAKKDLADAQAAEAEKRRKEAKNEETKADDKGDETEKKKARKAAAAAARKAAVADAEAKRLAAEAERIGGRVIDSKILQDFTFPRTMVAFTKAIKSAKVAKEYHAEAAKYVIDKEVSVRTMREEIAEWWYEVGGQRLRDFEVEEKAKTFERKERKKINFKDAHEYMMHLAARFDRLAREVKTGLKAIPVCQSNEVMADLKKNVREFEAQFEELKKLIPPDDVEVVIDATWRDDGQRQIGYATKNGD